jgi:hypothetical protein
MVENATKLLDTLPEDYKDFYLKRMITILEAKIYKESTSCSDISPEYASLKNPVRSCSYSAPTALESSACMLRSSPDPKM